MHHSYCLAPRLLHVLKKVTWNKTLLLQTLAQALDSVKVDNPDEAIAALEDSSERELARRHWQVMPPGWGAGVVVV